LGGKSVSLVLNKVPRTHLFTDADDQVVGYFFSHSRLMYEEFGEVAIDYTLRGVWCVTYVVGREFFGLVGPLLF
jgi:hypothetical protein